MYGFYIIFYNSFSKQLLLPRYEWQHSEKSIVLIAPTIFTVLFIFNTNTLIITSPSFAERIF